MASEDGKIPDGRRNETLASIGGFLRSKGLDAEAIEEALLTVNEVACDPPDDVEKVARTARSVGGYEVGVTPDRLTDTGNGRRFAAQHVEKVRYCHPHRRWFVWDGTRWKVDDSGAIRRLAKETAGSIFAEAGQAEDDERKALLKHANRTESRNSITAMLELAQSEHGIPVSPVELDAYPWEINTESGILNLKTGELFGHDPRRMHTRLAGARFEKLGCPRWLAFLDRIFAGDDELIEYVQRAIGYSLTGDTREQCLFFLYGTGRNGKTTLINVLLALLGEYCAKTPTETVMSRRGDVIPNDLARLKGARVAVAQEVEDGQTLSESRVKDMTGGDVITARFLHGEWFDFRPQFKLWMYGNHKPVIRGTDEGIWRRIRLVPFNVRISKEEKDGDLLSKLTAELPGIFAWAVRGCLRWREDGLPVPAVIRAATGDYRSEMDVLGAFIDERCVLGKGLSEKSIKLFEAYKAWAEAGGEKTMSQTKFGRKMGERELIKEKKRDGAYWMGVGLK